MKLYKSSHDWEPKDEPDLYFDDEGGGGRGRRELKIRKEDMLSYEEVKKLAVAIDALGDLPDYVEEDDPPEDRECQAVREEYEKLCQGNEELEQSAENLVEEGLITQEECDSFVNGNAPAKRTWLLENHDRIVLLRDAYRAREEERERREQEEEEREEKRATRRRSR